MNRQIDGQIDKQIDEEVYKWIDWQIEMNRQKIYLYRDIRQIKKYRQKDTKKTVSIERYIKTVFIDCIDRQILSIKVDRQIDKTRIWKYMNGISEKKTDIIKLSFM